MSRFPAPSSAALPAAEENAVDSRGLLTFLGTVALLFLVVLAFSLASKLKTALEDEVTTRLRLAAELALQWGEDSTFAPSNTPETTVRLDALRTMTDVTTIALYDGRGRNMAQVTRVGGDTELPRKLRVLHRPSSDADLSARMPELDAGGGMSLVVPAPLSSSIGAVLVRLDPNDLGALTAARVLFTIGKIVSAAIAFAGVLILLRWLRPAPAARIAPRPSPDTSSDVDVVLGTMKQVMHTLKDSETEYRTMWSAAEQNAEHFRTTSASIVESMSSGIVAFDRQGRVTLSNRAAENVLGEDSQNSVGRSVEEVFGPDDPLTCLAQDILEGREGTSRLEVARPARRGPGSNFALSAPANEAPANASAPTAASAPARWIGVSSSVLRREDGALAGGILLVTDLTEARAQREAQELKERLSAVGEMSAGIAHEIKNSLHSLLGFAHLLREDAKGSEPPLAVRGILEEMRSLEAMVKRILEFSKPSNLSREAVDVGRLFEDTKLAVQEKARAAHVTLQLETALGIPPLEVDALAMRGAFVNLAMNAIEAMTEGGTLTMRAEVEGALGSTSPRAVCLRFRDTGPGIVEADQARVFAPFFSTKRTGIGLGLALVQKTITDHGGSIELQSTVGRGTEFIVRLRVGPARPEGATRAGAFPSREAVTS